MPQKIHSAQGRRMRDVAGVAFHFRDLLPRLRKRSHEHLARRSASRNVQNATDLSVTEDVGSRKDARWAIPAVASKYSQTSIREKTLAIEERALRDSEIARQRTKRRTELGN